MIDLLSRALIPIFFVIVLGYFAGVTGKIDNKHVTTLNTLVMDFALPAAMFGSIVQTSKAELFGQWKLTAIPAVGLVILRCLVYALQRKIFKLPPSASAILAMSISLPNSAATAIPLMATIFGSAGNIRAVVGIAVGSIVLSPLTLVMFYDGLLAAPCWPARFSSHHRHHPAKPSPSGCVATTSPKQGV